MDLPLTRAVSPHLDVRESTGSTNADLREQAGTLPHLAIVLTDDQTAGRGRLDRTWIAPAGSSLAISVLIRDLPDSLAARGWIPLAAGVAMTDAVAEQLPDRTVAVKWPNDVLVDGRKISGILAEATTDAVVVGAGVNTAMTAAQLPVPTATSFAVLGADVDADRLIAGYVRRLAELIDGLATGGDATASGLHAQATARCATLGLEVTVSLPGDQVLQGTAIALDADGRLVVMSGGIPHAVSAGDVVHVRPV